METSIENPMAGPHGRTCDCNEGDYAARLSRLRHSAVDHEGQTWESACVVYPDGCCLSADVPFPLPRARS